MTEKDLLKKLNNLKVIKPVSQWKISSREILLNQISQGDELSKAGWFSVFKNFLPLKTMSRMSQPVWAVILILVFAFGSGVAGIRASRDTKPGDSLYIAKMLSERTRATFTFGEKEKAKLSVEFASNRAKEIAQIIEDDNKEKSDNVDKLTNDFRNEISVAKKRLEKIGAISSNVDNSKAAASVNEDQNMFVADSGKDNKGIQISEGATANDNQSAAKDAKQVGASEQVQANTAGTGGELQKTLAEAEKLFAEKNYSATVDKLIEVNNAIDKNIEVNGTIPAPDNNATSTK